MKTFVLAGTHSGVGKTSISLGLMAAFSRRGKRVQPYKVGPDYLDPTYHELACGQVSRNLDGWMTGRAGVLESFARGSGDLAIVEGVMGLYDGASPDREDGSTAEVAKWLGAPVVLVIDAGGMARSAAAVVEGFRRFDPAVPLLGVIFNQIGGDRHRDLLREAVEPIGLPVLGALPKRPDLRLESRHLGLLSATASVLPPDKVEALADWVEQAVDLEALWQHCPDVRPEAMRPPLPRQRLARIGFALDDALHFYYRENLERLEEAGAELVPFSPCADRALPDVAGLYLGGGYPEAHAAALADNRPLLSAMKEFAGPIYGECGGLMVLFEAIVTPEGRYQMAGVLPGEAVMHERLRSLGYAEIETVADSDLGPAGTVFRGHQFRYSEPAGLPDSLERIYQVRDRRGSGTSEGFRRGRALGSYVHAHWGSNPDLPGRFVRACAR